MTEGEPGWQARVRYQVYRQAAFFETEQKYFLALPEWSSDPGGPIPLIPRLDDIGENALRFWREEWLSAPPPLDLGGGFAWDDIADWLQRHSDRFEVAIWYHSTLCGLAGGLPSEGSDNLTIHFLERFFGENPLAKSIASLVMDAADSYARLLRKRRLKLKNPLSGTERIYRALGFELAETINNNTYYAREVRYGPGSTPPGD